MERRELDVAELSYREAVAAGIAQEMERDPSVYFLGEDVARTKPQPQLTEMRGRPISGGLPSLGPRDH